MRNRRFIKEVRSQTASSQSKEELNHSVDHKTSGQRQTPKSADKTGEMSGKPPAHDGTGAEKKGNQLEARAPGGRRANPARGSGAGAGEHEKQDKPSYAEVTRGALTRGRARNLGLQL